MIIVPIEKYKNLISKNLSNFEDYDNINFTKNSLEKIKKNSKMNPSTKNILYNQEFRRFLKMRKDELDKPVKVKIDNDKNVLSKITPEGTKNILLTDENNQDFEQIENENKFLNSTQNIKNEFTPKIPNTISTNQTFTTPNRNNNTSLVDISTPNTFNSESEKEEFVLNYVQQNPKEFNITENRVINDIGSVMLTSDVVKSVKKIVNPQLGVTTPTGTKVLKKRLFDNKNIKKILDTPVNRKPRAAVKKLDPAIWK